MFPDGNRHKSIPPKRKAYVFHIHGLPSAACGHKDLIPPTLIKDKNFLFYYLGPITWGFSYVLHLQFYVYWSKFLCSSFETLSQQNPMTNECASEKEQH